MLQRIAGGLLLGVFAVLAACGGVPGSPEGTVKAFGSAMADNDVGFVWDALPEPYQDDVDQIIAEVAGKLDEQVYDKTFLVMGKLVDVLDDQSEYILHSQMAGGMGVDVEALEDDWDSVLEFVETFVESDISSLDGLADLDVGAFLDQTATQLMDQAERLATLDEQGRKQWEERVESLSKIEVEVVEESDGQATLEVKVPGQPSMRMELAEVDGRWVPRELADDWEQMVSGIKRELAQVDFAANKAQYMQILGALEGTLDTLAGAESQEEFDQALQSSIPLVMGSLLGGMSSPPDGSDSPFEYDLF